MREFLLVAGPVFDAGVPEMLSQVAAVDEASRLAGVVILKFWLRKPEGVLVSVLNNDVAAAVAGRIRATS